MIESTAEFFHHGFRNDEISALLAKRHAVIISTQQFVHVYTGSSWILSLPKVECACVTAICFQVTKKCQLIN